MPDTPKKIPPAVLEALKRGDKAAALKLLKPGTLSSVKDVMQLVQQLQESGVAKNVKVNVKTQVHERGGHAASTPHTPHAATPPLSRPDLAPGEQPRTGGGALAILALIVAA